MTTRVLALEAEVDRLMGSLSVMAELAEEGQEQAALVALALVVELDRLETELAAERARPVMA